MSHLSRAALIAAVVMLAGACVDLKPPTVVDRCGERGRCPSDAGLPRGGTGGRGGAPAAVDALGGQGGPPEIDARAGDAAGPETGRSDGSASPGDAPDGSADAGADAADARDSAAGPAVDARDAVVMGMDARDGALPPAPDSSPDRSPDGAVDAPPDAPAPLLANGAACAAGPACASGFCVDGVCCGSACTESCSSCKLAGMVGTCAAVPNGQDPDNECPTDPVAGCARDGLCNGARACRRYGAGTVCQAAACSGAVHVSARTCDGVGTCRPAVETTCTPYTCATTGCAVMCAAHADCAAGYYCNAGQCSGLTLGLLAYLRLDEGTGGTTADAAGANTGTLFGGPTWVVGGFPAARFANSHSLSFDGVDDLVQISPAGLPAIEAPKSVSLWVSYAAPPGTPPPQNFIALLNELSNGAVQIGLRDGKLAVWRTGGIVLVSAASGPGTGWRHVAYTYNGMTHTLYVDGAVAATSTTASETGATAKAFLGTFITPLMEGFGGRMDDVRIWNRALSATEVAAVYAGQ